MRRIAHAEPGRWSSLETRARNAKAQFFVEDDDNKVKRRAQDDCCRMIKGMQGDPAYPSTKLSLSSQEARNLLGGFATEGGSVRLAQQRTGGGDGDGDDEGRKEEEEEDVIPLLRPMPPDPPPTATVHSPQTFP